MLTGDMLTEKKLKNERLCPRCGKYGERRVCKRKNSGRQFIYFDHDEKQNVMRTTTKRCYISKALILKIQREEEAYVANYVDAEHEALLQRKDQPFFRWQPEIRA